MTNETMEVYNVIVNENDQGKKRFVYPDYKVGNITLKGNIIKRIVNHKANFYGAVIDACASMIVQDSKLGVNKIGSILRQTCAVKINNAVLSVAVKGVKEGLSNKCIAENMADALLNVASAAQNKRKKTTKKTTSKNAAGGNVDTTNDDLEEIKNEAVKTAVQLAEDNLKARIASKLSEIVASGHKAKSVDNLLGELTELITYLRIPEEIIQCKTENVKAIKKSKAAKAKAAKAKAAKAKAAKAKAAKAKAAKAKAAKAKKTK